MCTHALRLSNVGNISVMPPGRGIHIWVSITQPSHVAQMKLACCAFIIGTCNTGGGVTVIAVDDGTGYVIGTALVKPN
jgi:predicted hydrolase (HD superfamily)